MHDLASPLEDLLRRQLAAYTKFRDLLQNEHRALVQRDRATLDHCMGERAYLVTELETLDKSFAELLRKRGIDASTLGMQKLLDALPRGGHPLRALWRQLLTLASECRDQNAVNGRIIDLNRQQTDRMLRILTGNGPGGSTTYAADGKVANRKASVTIATV